MEPLLVSSILFVVLMVIWVFAHFLANLFTAMDNRGWLSNWWIGAQIATDDLAGDGVVNARGNICLSMIQPFGVRKRVSN